MEFPSTQEAKMDTTQQHIANGGGICGTCARPATATAENEGYSYCCNDRIEYGLEASETYQRSQAWVLEAYNPRNGDWITREFATEAEAQADADALPVYMEWGISSPSDR